MTTRTSTALRRPATGVPALASACAGMAAWSGSATAAGERAHQVKTTVDGRTAEDPDIPVGSGRIADTYPAGTTTHVALHLGDDRILETAPPRNGDSAHVRGSYGRGPWTAHAVRHIS